MESSESRSAESIATDYWLESSRPLVSLVFVIPLLLAYELGLVVLGPQAMRNGADLWLRWLLEWLGFGQFLVLPLATCCGLLAWHHVRGDRWRFPWPVLSGMLLESVLLGILLLAVAHVQGSILAALQPAAWTTDAADPDGLDHLVAFLGAGVYEETLFRLLLLPLVAFGWQALGADRQHALGLAVAVTSLIFAAAHYRLDLMLGDWHLVTEVGESFAWASFLFRLVAGAFFSAVFLWRGFGIAVGTHALYDILVFLG
jgi:hypothetical protein